MRLAPVVKNESGRLQVCPRRDNGGAEVYFIIFQSPSRASFSDEITDIGVFRVATSTTKAEIEFNQKAKQLEVLHRINLWKANLSGVAVDASVDGISATVDSLLEAIGYGGVAAVNLASLNFDFVNAEHLVAVLRTTFSWREQILGWKSALVAAPEVLRRQGLDPEEELFGLADMVDGIAVR